MASLVPLDPSVAQQAVTTTLGNYECVVGARWNTRAQTWFLDVRELDNTPILLGERLVLGVKLGRRSTHPLFAGTGAVPGYRPFLVAVDLSKTGIECGFDELNRRVLVYYLDEFDAFLASTPNQSAPTNGGT